MNNEAIGKFHKTEIFRDLPEHERNNLLEQAINRKYRRGEFPVHQEEVWPYVVYVLSGQLRWAMLSATGKEHVLFYIDPSEVFWAHSIFDGEPMPGYLFSTRNTEVLLWDKETMLRTLRRYPDTMWEVTKILTRIMRRAREIIYSLAFKPVAGRLASLLLQQYQDTEQPSLDRNLTLNDLAATVAATPEVVCRLLYQFQEDGILEVTRATIHINDMDALKNIQEG
jgi:CRP-like cAMP-binding protein